MKIVNMFRLLWTIICVASKAFCSDFVYFTDNDVNETNYSYFHLFNKLCDEYVKEVESKYGIECLCLEPILSGSNTAEVFSDITYKFACYANEGTVDEARKLTICSIELLHDKLNQASFLRKYLPEYPLNIKRVIVNIEFFRKDNKSEMSSGIVLTNHVRNKIKYIGYDKKKKIFFKIHEETYEEACKILAQQGLLN